MLTSSEMRAVERAAINSGAVSGYQLMERAGQCVVAAMKDRWPGWNGSAPAPGTGEIVLVLCGPGNNGGDGYVVARLLAEAGCLPSVVALGDPGRRPADAAQARDLWTGPAVPFGADAMIAVADRAGQAGQEALVIVDALFGIGQRAPLDDVCDAVGDLVDHMMGGRGPTPFFVAVDLPTGYDADTGAALARRPVPADLTVTFHEPKPIHGMPHFLDGDLVVADIGL